MVRDAAKVVVVELVKIELIVVELEIVELVVVEVHKYLNLLQKLV